MTKAEKMKSKTGAHVGISTGGKMDKRKKNLKPRVEKSERELLLELLEKVFYEGEFIHLALRKLFRTIPAWETERRLF